MTHFWAKTIATGGPGISVYRHMINTGCVARCLAETVPELLLYFCLRTEEVGALAALHDLGKITPGFQRKCRAWLEENGLLDTDRLCRWDAQMESRHGTVSHAAIQDFLLQRDVSRKVAQILPAVLGAHHGRLNLLPDPRGIRPPAIGQITETRSGIDWDAERREAARKVWRYFGAESSRITITMESPALWWVAGLTTVADWIASDERLFSPGRGAETADVGALASKALAAIGFRRARFVPGLSFHDLFHDPERPDIVWQSNEMQRKAVSVITGPGVYVIEAPMGMGKTEAALWAAYLLLLAGKSHGIYFALPTQATSNRIHLRVNQFLRRICQDPAESRLIHGNAWLMDRDCALCPAATGGSDREDGDARAGRDWFASARRVLLAPFGVGTVDQALLGIVAAKHFFVRHFALAGKVVILDEIHSYDLYTGTLINKLIETLEGLGCTVIVLSATLTEKRRSELVPLPEDPCPKAARLYPLITGRRGGVPIAPSAAAPPGERHVRVDFISRRKAQEEALALARRGGAVLWICNTVDEALDQYRKLAAQARGEFPLGLLHSRFPFWRREALEEEWLGRLGKNGENRCGCILVSTQIVEQSVDIDADLLITELAPTDMLLQRLGRLWRHEREDRCRHVESARLYILEEEATLEELRRMAPDAIKKALGAKSHVYAPFVLLRSLEVWRRQSELAGSVAVPAQIRTLLESTYEDREVEPDSWWQLSDEWFGTDSAKRMFALRNTNYWQVALEDEEGVQTRINDVETVVLVLCSALDGKQAAFVDGTTAPLGGEAFLLDTAQAVHRNLVKVPKWCFKRIEPNPVFAGCLKGSHCAGLVGEDGAVRVDGLEDGIRLFYSEELGVVIEKASH